MTSPKGREASKQNTTRCAGVYIELYFAQDNEEMCRLSEF